VSKQPAGFLVGLWNDESFEMFGIHQELVQRTIRQRHLFAEQ